MPFSFDIFLSFSFNLRAFRGQQVLGVLRERGAHTASKVLPEPRASLAPKAPRYSAGQHQPSSPVSFLTLWGKDVL